jgi:hypothetical protein
LRQLEAPGLSIGLTPEAGRRLDLAALPWRWPTSLNATELAALLALPVGEADLPGLAPVHPRQLAPARGVLRPSRSRVVVAEATAGGPTTNGEAAWLTRSDDALLRHLHVIGPTGVGKSVLLLNLVLQDMARGAGAVVIEPKGDLVADLLERVPDGRRGDVVVFDPTCPDGVVGLNPLAGSGSPELRADRVLSIFTDIFGEALGPRTTDILHACLLTLARRDDASLVQVPRLLTDPAFRRARVGPVAGDLALGPFWAWYEGLRDGERSSVIAPLMNKLRAVVLLNPFVRRTLGQVRPRFDVGQVFTEQKILLVPLPVASLGSEGSALLGSLVVGQVWQAARARIHQPIAERRPVPVVLDECQQFLRLSDLPDALATSRSYGVGWVLAHQYLAQLPPDLRAAVLTNCRSRVAFQTSHDDAQTLARESGGRLEADDFTALPAFHVYASLLEHGQVQPYASGRTLPPPPVTADANGLRRASAARYGRTPAEIEAGFLAAPDVPPGHPSGVGRTSVESAHGDGTDSSIGRMRRPATVDVVSSRSSGRVEPSQANPLVGMPIEAVKATATLPPGVVLDAGADRGAGNSQATDQGAPAADEASTDEVGRSRP